MFEALGLLVDLVPRVVEDFVEEGFEEAMVTNDFEGALAAGLGEMDSAMLLVGDERGLEGGELLQHIGDGGGRDGEMGCDLGGGNLALGTAAELEDGLEIVVDGLAAGGWDALGGGGAACCSE